MNENNRIFDVMESEINNSDMPEQEKIRMLKKIHTMRDRKINLMITGATGCGKSSTINALFNKSVSKVGQGADSETMDITRHELNNLVIWDSPGLGDSKEKDIEHSKKIIKKLNEKDAEGNALIDLVLVVIDGSSRDMGTSYQLINEVIIPNLGEDKQGRILVAINKCDMAMSGRGWNFEGNYPESKLVSFLDEKVNSVHKRIHDATGVDIEPIYYAAGFMENDDVQHPYNLSKLLYYIIKHTPKEKRIVYANNMSKDPEVWKSNDEIKNYNEEIRNSFIDSVVEGICEGAERGELVGAALYGEAGRIVGKFFGGVAGGAAKVVEGIGNFFKEIFS